MGPHDGVNASCASASFMLRFQPMQPFRDGPRQLLIRLRRINENSVPTDVGALEHVQEDESRWLRVRTAIHVPGHRRGPRSINVAESGVANAIVCDMNLGGMRKVGTGWKDGQRPEVPAEVEDGGDGQQIFEVLGAESDNFALRDEEGEFVFCLRCEAAELDARDLGAC